MDGTGAMEEGVLSLEHVKRATSSFVHTYMHPKNKYLYCVMELQCIGSMNLFFFEIVLRGCVPLTRFCRHRHAALSSHRRLAHATYMIPLVPLRHLLSFVHKGYHLELQTSHRSKTHHLNFNY